MKFIYFSLVSLALSAAAMASLTIDNSEVRTMRGEVKPREFGIENIIIGKILEEAKTQRRNVLKEAKFFLVNGETELARYNIKKLLLRDQDQFIPVALRYLALAEFQDGNWKEAFNILSRPELTKDPHYSHICGLKIITRIALSDTFEIDNEWERCQNVNKRDLRQKDTEWMDILVNLVAKRKKNVSENYVKSRRIKNLAIDDLRSFLKLVLYLNIEDKIVDELEALDSEAIEDDETRTIMAQIYFRQGRFVYAWKLMEDLTNPNAEIMKGNLWLLRGNHELAYAQFKLALQVKANSHNAIERALPLAWVLEQWKDGLIYADRIYAYDKNRLQKLTTTAAFAVKLEKWEEADHKLAMVHRERGEDTALEVSQLSSYVALNRKDSRGMKKHALKACEAGDMSACWLVNAENTWGNLPSLINRDEEVNQGEPLWKTLLNESEAEFKDKLYIEQKDIEELDDALIKLVSES
jgi:hypothetical protein